MRRLTTASSAETKKIGLGLAQKIRGGVICLSGDLGAGKTTFAQGLLRGLKIKGPYTSPTFAIMKHYQKKDFDVYHIDAYRIKSKDLLNLGWKELIANKKNILIVEWAERVRKIIPKNARWIEFKWLDDKKRSIVLK